MIAEMHHELDFEYRMDRVYTPINGTCGFSDLEDRRSVSVRSQVLFCYDRDDVDAEKLAVVYLFREGWAQQQELALAFGHGASTIRVWARRVEKEGVVGVSRKKRRSPLLKLGGAQDHVVRRLFKKGLSNYAIGRHLNVSEYAIRLALFRLGLKREKKQSPMELDLELSDETQGAVLPDSAEAPFLESGGHAHDETVDVESECIVESTSESSNDLDKPQVSDKTENSDEVAGIAGNLEETKDLELPALIEVPPSLDLRGESRDNDRFMAVLGLLNDAAPVFRDSIRCGNVGVLLAIPLILRSRILAVFQKVYKVLPGFFGLRNTVMCLQLMAFLRVKRPEQLKQKNPYSLGALIGLDRLPEMKTLRGKLKKLASRGRALELMRVLAQTRVNGYKKKGCGRLGFLYVDGHVKEYRGGGKLGKTYIARRNCINKGSTDHWIHDEQGSPLFVVTSPLNEGLTQILEQIIDEIEHVVCNRPLTIVFDRGGWKKALFSRLVKRGCHIITYRKGWDKKLQESDFQECSSVIDGQAIRYKLHDMSVCIHEEKLKDGKVKRLWMRQVTRLKKGRQIPVLTTRQDLEGVEILFRMFNRWRQENFFKYAREEYLLDALLEYGVEAVPEGLDHPNPEWVKYNKQLIKFQQSLDKQLATESKLTTAHKLETTHLKEAEFESERKKIRSQKGKLSRLKKRQETVSSALITLERSIEQSRLKRSGVPKRISATDLECLPRELRLLADCIKMTAYQIETELVDMVKEHYVRVFDEGRKLVVAAFQSEGTLEKKDNNLVVTLDQQSSPHRTKAIKVLCEKLNQMDCCFPGSRLRLRYRIAQ